ncbi:hydantoinase B/oxoprolinase family protein [Falsiroseomonas sp. HW251]|uniref:hydantoinase B/oxoprolinase family protein n=1 Tax=Falsiroseomonas sp. HW251 TaxID=3390998 RepID=UPI003D3219D4
MTRRFEVALDQGGSHLDVIAAPLHDPAEPARIAKFPRARSQDIAATLLGFMAAEGIAAHEVASIRIATTLAANALLTGAASPVALVTTRGFADLPDLGRQSRRDPDAPDPPAPTPPWLSPPAFRFNVAGRLAADGTEQVALDIGGLPSSLPDLPIAICLLHAHRNPAHELRVTEAIRAARPDAVISLSHRVDPQPREFERMLATLADASLKPLLAKTLGAVARRLGAAGLPAPSFALADGTLAATEAALDAPLSLAFSGPAAGAIAVSRMVPRGEVIGLDVGGTTAEVSLVRDGVPLRTAQVQLGDMTLRCPALDVESVGIGGDRPTARGGPILSETPAEVLAVAAVQLAEAVRRIALRRNIHPDVATLVVGGGFGPRLAAAVANHMGCPRVVIPPAPGLLSASGLLDAAPVLPAADPPPPLASDTTEAAQRAILRLALEGLADRMQDSLLAAAKSPVARDGMDCAAALFLPDGRVLAQARSLPLLLGGMIPAVAGILRAFPAATMGKGDGFLTNDPWSGGTHLPDLILARPVLVERRVVALAATILHHQDVGGLAPGSIPPDARDIFQEGLRLPPVRWRQAGAEDAGIAAILAANTRTPDMLRADLDAQWQSVSQAEAEVSTLARRIGAEAFARRGEALLREARDALAAVLDGLPEADAAAEEALEGDGITPDPVAIRATLRRVGGPRLIVDFAGSSPQTAGPVNAAPSGLVAACFALLRRMAPDAAANHGLLDLLDIRLPEGSVVNPHFPAPVNARTATVKLATNALFAAYALLSPGPARAPNAGVAVVMSVAGTDDSGRPWMFTEIMAGGEGGGPDRPGLHALSADVSNARNLPAEILEDIAPIRVEAVERHRGSGGAGLHSGGDGVRRAYRLLSGRAEVSYRGERHLSGAPGAQGGGPGGLARCRLLGADGAMRDFPSKARFAWIAGETLVIETAGGGGWGAQETTA